jgi:chloramphenicol-sensitive protein RarD
VVSIPSLPPSLQFLLAVLVFHEAFTPVHALTFAFIWTALAILTWDLRRRLRHERAEEVA